MRYKRMIVWILLGALMLTSLPQGVNAQQPVTEPQPLPEGIQKLYLPAVKGPVRLFSMPTFGIVRGGAGQMTTDEVTSFCPDFLSEVSFQASGLTSYCLGGNLYPVISNKGIAATGESWSQNGPVGVAGPGSVEAIATKTNVVVNGIRVDASRKFNFGGSDALVGFPLDLNPKATSDFVTSAATQADYSGTDLFVKLASMDEETARRFPIPVHYTWPVYTVGGHMPQNLGARCFASLEGQEDWPLYPTEPMINVDAIGVGGIWAPNTNPLQVFPPPVAVCMGPYRYLSWPDLWLRPELEAWRNSVVTQVGVPNDNASSFSLPQWDDDQFGGHWIFTMAAVAGGGIILAGKYVVAGIVTTSSALLVIPEKAIKCIILEGSIESCSITQAVATQSHGKLTQ